MQVLKVVAEGLTTSFRYPHFMQQIHPTFQMPPPATIYGHICSALGEWFDPTGVEFAYHFTHRGDVKDVEHIIVLSPSGARSRLPGTKIPAALHGNVNPFDRELGQYDRKGSNFLIKSGKIFSKRFIYPFLNFFKLSRSSIFTFFSKK